MKKMFLSMIAVAMVMAACSKADVATPLEVDTTVTAYITGYVTYEPNTTATNPTTFVPSNNVVINATVDYADLNGFAASGALPVATSYNASTGMYTISVPAPRNATTPTSVSISVSGFAGTQTQFVGGGPATTNVSGFYNPATANFTQSVEAGQTVLGSTITFTFQPSPVN